MRQVPPPDYVAVTIPIERSLLFRIGVHKNNPEGKALALDTPIPTPDGWRRFGELGVGDRLFDEVGRIRHVTAVSPVWSDRPCYRLRFTGGTEIIADAEHLWATTTLLHHGGTWPRGRHPAKLRATREIAATVRTPQGSSNHAIPWAAPLQYPAQALVIPPYTLGLWLGDGHSLTARITTHQDDIAEQTTAVMDEGYPVSEVRQNGRSDKGRVYHVGGGFQTALRVLGLLGNKHVPAAYLRGSVDQRLRLLQGLLDADGHIDHFGRCEFVSTIRPIAEAVLELVRSLGCGAVLRSKAPSADRRLTAWQVKFTPSTFAPFRLTRKLKRIKAVRARMSHYITAAEPVPSMPVRCIEVDSPSGLFLAGEAMIPTHNSILRGAYRSWYMRTRFEELLGIGVERDLAGYPILTVDKEGPDIWSGTTAATQKRGELERFVVRIRRDQCEGAVLPWWADLKLLSAPSRRQFDLPGLLAYYDRQIALSMMADFLLIGHEKVGSFALTREKTELFALSVEACLHSLASVINRHAIPRLLVVNGWPPAPAPRLIPGEIRRPTLEDTARFLREAAVAGMPLFPDDALEAYLRAQARFPARTPVEGVAEKALATDGHRMPYDEWREAVRELESAANDGGP
jgi:hypothetical protein